MMERKNKQKAGLLAILVIVTGVLFWFSRSEDSQAVDKLLFRLPDYQAISKVIFQKQEEKIVLSFNGSRWKVNDHFNADRNMIKVLFATFQQAEPKRPVASALRDSLRNYVLTKGVKVSLYRNEQPVQEFFAGGNESKTRAYFVAADDQEVYEIHIPGYRVYVSGIFELGANQWRDKLIFGLNWENFQSLDVQYPQKPAENFSVSMQENFFAVEGLAKTDTAKLNSFLDHVSFLTANEFLEPGPFTDSLKSIEPFMIITVNDIGKRKYSLTLFRTDGNLVPGIVNEDDAVTFSRLKIQPIIRPKSFFKVE